MGKDLRWFRGLLGLKKDKENMDNSVKTKKRCCFGKSMKDPPESVTVENEQNIHAIAVAATAPAAADATVGGAQAAVSVVRHTSDGMGTLFSGEETWAATKIQSNYRGHSVRRDLRALKGLVKLQALARGFLARKRAAATLKSMQGIMDSFRNSPTINEHNSGTDETEACEKIDSKDAVPKKKISVKSKRTLDGEKPPVLSRSYSFDSSVSRTRVVDAQDGTSLPPYDPIENYISPRPKYLRFSPDRQSKILARQENVSRMIKSASFDCGVSFLEDVSSYDCSVEETEDLAKESLVSTHDDCSVGETEDLVKESLVSTHDNCSFKETEDLVKESLVSTHDDCSVEETEDLVKESLVSTHDNCSFEETEDVVKKSLVSTHDNCSFEETEDLVKESLASTYDESEGEKEEFEDVNGWSGNVSLKYLIVVILLILTTMTICLMNSPIVSYSEVGNKGFSPMMLTGRNLSENMVCYDFEKWESKDLELVERQHGHTTEMEVNVNTDETDEMETLKIEAEKESDVQILGADLGQNDLELSSDELVERQHGHTTEVTEMELDVNNETDKRETPQIEAEKESHVQILGADLGQNDVNKDTDVIKNPRNMVKGEIESCQTEPEKESCILGAVLGQNVVTEESEIVKLTVEKDDGTNNGPHETETEEIKDTDTLLSKLANVDPKFAAFSGVVVIILGCASVLYYLIHRVTTSAHKNKVSKESSSPVGRGRKSLNLEISGYSPSRGSFTVEKMIVKKERSKTPEVTLSRVRRSSRIHNHNRSVTQSP